MHALPTSDKGHYRGSAEAGSNCFCMVGSGMKADQPAR
jgi:hypothetical protein